MRRVPRRKLLTLPLLGALPALLRVSGVAAYPSRPRARAIAADGGPGTGLPPNELGLVLILEYHNVAYPEGAYQRTPDNFRADLEMLYDAGFRTASMQSVIDGQIDVPAGTSPVVLTFDDSWSSQLTLDAYGNATPYCAAGILEDFAASHPGFGTRAAFYIIWNQLFGTAGTRAAAQLQYLASHGYELGDHTLHHPFLSKLSGAAVQSEIGDELGWIATNVTDQFGESYAMQTVALPYGDWPANHELAADGVASDGSPYSFAAVIGAWGGPSPTPARVDWSGMWVPRTLAGNGAIAGVLNSFAVHPERQYVSDGDPRTLTYPGYLTNLLAASAATRWTLQPY